MLDGLLSEPRNKAWRSGGLFVRERPADPYLPHVGHPTAQAVELDDGSVMATGQLHGKPAELLSNRARNGILRSIAAMFQQLQDDSLTLNIHLVHHRIATPWEVPDFGPGGEWPAYFARRYKEIVLDGHLFENTWFISTIIAPRNPLGGARGGKFLKRVADRLGFSDTRSIEDRLHDLENLWLKLSRFLGDYDLRRLGLREEEGDDPDDPPLFSEIAEALRFILTARRNPCPLPAGRLGEAIYVDRAIFGGVLGWKNYAVLLPDRVRYGTLFGLRHYMRRVGKGRFDRLLSAPFELVATHSFGYLPDQTVLAKGILKDRQMEAAGDRAGDLQADLREEINQVSSGNLAKGWSHFSCAVYADSLRELQRIAAAAETMLVHSGAQITRETHPGALEPAYFAQLSGNDQWRARPAKINTENLAHFITGFNAFPRGQKEGWWGPSLMPLKTRAGTTYDLVEHVEDAAIWAFYGPTRMGKTTVANTLLAMMRWRMKERGAIFRFGKDRDGTLLMRALGGRSIIPRKGERTGLVPYKGLTNTPAARAFLWKWTKGLIRTDELGPIRPDDDLRMGQAVEWVMKKPLPLRGIWALRQYMGGWDDPMSAGSRLQKWCRGEPLGWVFDGEEDEVGIGEIPEPLVIRDFDFTEILDDPEIINPAAAYAFYFVNLCIDGRRVANFMDEAAAYLNSRHSYLFRDEYENGFLRARKNNVFFGVSTQQPEHLLAGENGDSFAASIFGQTQTIVSTANPSADPDIWIGKLGFTPGMFRAITQTMLPGSRQILIRRTAANMDDETVIIDFNMEGMEECLAVLSGRRNRVDFYDRLCVEAGTDDPKVVMPVFMRRFREARD
jgi:type IV secretion system protein VirB4